MLIKIIRCSKDEFWYHNNIGMVLDAIDCKNFYLVKDNDIEFIVNKDDAVPFNRREKIDKILGNIK